MGDRGMNWKGHAVNEKKIFKIFHIIMAEWLNTDALAQDLSSIPNSPMAAYNCF